MELLPCILELIARKQTATDRNRPSAANTNMRNRDFRYGNETLLYTTHVPHATGLSTYTYTICTPRL